MNTVHDPPELIVVMRRFALARHRFLNKLARSIGVSRNEFDALDYIQEAGTITPARLAELLDVTGGAVTSLVDKLEAAGYVRREANKADRRSILISLTPEMEGIAQMAFSSFAEEIIAASETRMTSEERAAAVRLMEAAIQAAANASQPEELKRVTRPFHRRFPRSK